ncbi:MAG: PKD domain-containing protein [bacterium JZ-2024 1]
MKTRLEIPRKYEIFGWGVENPEKVLPVVYGARTKDRAPGRFPAVFAFRKRNSREEIYVLSVEPLEMVTSVYRNGERLTDGREYEVYPSAPVELPGGGTGRVMAWLKWKRGNGGNFSYDGYSSERNPVRALEDFLGKYGGIERKAAENYFTAQILDSLGIQINWRWEERTPLPEALSVIGDALGLWVFLDEEGRLCIQQGDWGFGFHASKEWEEGWAQEEKWVQDEKGWIETLLFRSNYRYVDNHWEVEAEATGCGYREGVISLPGLWMNGRRAGMLAGRIRQFLNTPVRIWTYLPDKKNWGVGDFFIRKGKMFRIVRWEWKGEEGNRRVWVKDVAEGKVSAGVVVKGLVGGGEVCVSGQTHYIRLMRNEPVLFALCVPQGWDRTVEWDFGDGSPVVSGLSVLHSFEHSGRYFIKAQSEEGEWFCEVDVEGEWAVQGFIQEEETGRRVRSIRLDGMVLPIILLNGWSDSPVLWRWDIAGSQVSRKEVKRYWEISGPDRVVEIILTGQKGNEEQVENRLRLSLSSPYYSEGKGIKIWIVQEGVDEDGACGRKGIFYGSFPLTLDFLSNGRNLQSPAYLWNFGDGQSSDEPNPVHTFLAPGDYGVSLTVQDGGVVLKDEVVVTLREDITAVAEYCLLPGEWNAMEGNVAIRAGDVVVFRIRDIQGGEGPFFCTLYLKGSEFQSGECHTVEFSKKGEYDFKFRIEDKNGMEKFLGNLLVKVK